MPLSLFCFEPKWTGKRKLHVVCQSSQHIRQKNTFPLFFLLRGRGWVGCRMELHGEASKPIRVSDEKYLRRDESPKFSPTLHQVKGKTLSLHISNDWSTVVFWNWTRSLGSILSHAFFKFAAGSSPKGKELLIPPAAVSPLLFYRSASLFFLLSNSIEHFITRVRKLNPRQESFNRVSLFLQRADS